MSKPVEAMTKATITLSRPLQLADGSAIETLKLREPEVKDFRVASQQAQSNVDREVIVVARCCGLVLEDVDKLAWKDYVNVQRFLFGEDGLDTNAE